MESSQVSWANNVPYDDLVKKCPFLAKKSGLQLVPQHSECTSTVETCISKSKKKRLKKRLKALSSANSSNPPGENHLEELSCVHQEIKAIESERNSSVSKKPHDVLFLKKNKLQPQAQIESNTAQIKPEVILKPKAIADNQREEIKCKEVKEMSSNSKNTRTPPKKEGGKQPIKGRTRDVVDGEILTPAINLNRGQVISEREPRKKAKPEAKGKKDSGTPEPLIKPIVPDSLKSDEYVKLVPKISNIKNVEAKTVNIPDVNKVLPPAIRDDATKSQIAKDESQTLSNKPSAPEKSREDILAEREAKKKAKQLAKTKKNEKPPELPVSEVIVPDVNTNIETKNFERTVEGKQVVEPTDDVTKSKAELRAERRAKQEAQRAAKEAEKKVKAAVNDSNKENRATPAKIKAVAPEKIELKETKLAIPSKVLPQKRIKLFSHLHIKPKFSQAQITQNIHPSIVKLGVKYSSRIINGSNARCIALLNCLKEVIEDYVTPEEKEFSRGLESTLGELTDYLSQCRPMAVSMNNALRHIKSHLTQLPNNVSDQEAKRKLLDVIDTFIREQIDVAGEAICETVKKKIANDDVILIYSCSSLLYRILVESHRAGREFSVVVVDGGPWFEGREMLRRLVEAGLKCTYVQVSAVSFIMRQATKVLLGAHALLANGCVMSRAGVSLITLAAHSCNVPVLVCCETYKFCERVQTDAFVYNELGSPEEVVGCDEKLSEWESLACLSPLSLLYDITPPDLVTAVVTELAILPCTSVPVILRVKPSDLIS